MKIQGHRYNKCQGKRIFSSKRDFQKTQFAKQIISKCFLLKSRRWHQTDLQMVTKVRDYFCHHLSRHIRVTNTAVIVTFKSPANLLGLSTTCGEDSTDTCAYEIRKIFPNVGSCTVEIIGVTWCQEGIMSTVCERGLYLCIKWTSVTTLLYITKAGKIKFRVGLKFCNNALNCWGDGS